MASCRDGVAYQEFLIAEKKPSGGCSKNSNGEEKETTHDFFLTLNARLYLWNIPLSIVVYRIDLILS